MNPVGKIAKEEERRASQVDALSESEARTSSNRFGYTMGKSTPLTVVVKTPDGAVEDIYVECTSAWDVLRLKSAISSKYPGRPEPLFQKVIHAGRLLQDAQVLSDALHQVSKLVGRYPVIGYQIMCCTLWDVPLRCILFSMVDVELFMCWICIFQ